MKNNARKALAVLLSSTMMLGCASTAFASETEDGQIKDLVTWATSEIETLFMQHDEGNANSIGGNCVSPLIEFDSYGNLVPAVATEWGTEDEGATWTFNLRDDVTWVDIDGNYLGDVTSQDWLTGLEWVLNYWKNDGYNVSMPASTIAGAQEYYDYTKELTEEEAKALTGTEEAFLEMVGIEAPDDHTLVYTCIDKIAYFDTLATCSCLYPVPQGMIDEVGVDGMVGISNEDFWYCGPYILTTFVRDNEKVLTRNESYWDKDCTLFDTVTILKIQDSLTDDTLWMTSEVDYAVLDSSTLSTILADPNSEWYNYLAETRVSKNVGSMFFNYCKLTEDGEPDTNWNLAVANDAFRLSLYWGLDWTNTWYVTNPINPLNCENLAYTSQGLGIFSDGTDYVDRVIELLDIPEGDGTSPRRYDAELAEQYKQQAIEELTAQGVTFPIQIDYYIKSGSQTAEDSAVLYKEMFEALGTDYVTFNIKTYVSSFTEEVTDPQLMSLCFSAWGADFGDVSNFIDQCIYGSDGAVYATSRMKLAETEDEHVIEMFTEFTDLADTAAAITGDKDARLEAYAQAESYMISNALVIPSYYTINWQLTKINEYSKMFAAYGINENVFKNWETSTTPYTTEEYQALKEAHESGN